MSAKRRELSARAFRALYTLCKLRNTCPKHPRNMEATARKVARRGAKAVADLEEKVQAEYAAIALLKNA